MGDGGIEVVSTRPAVTAAIGRALGMAARAGDVIALVGDLGAGKTQMVRGIAQGLGVDPSGVSSPTFVLMHEHEVAGGGPIAALIHIDAYRVQAAEELVDAGWTPEASRDAVTVIEWADRAPGLIERGAVRVELAHAGDEARRVRIIAPGGGDTLRRAIGAAVDRPAEPG